MAADRLPRRRLTGADARLHRPTTSPSSPRTSPPRPVAVRTHPGNLRVTPRDDAATEAALAARGLARGGYVLYLSRLAHAKGVDDLIEAYAASRSAASVDLVIAGNGPQADQLHALAAATPVAHRIRFLHDVDDDEKAHLMAGSRAFALPSKSMPEFTETFGIALTESMLSGGGPVITTDVGGIGEAVGDTALVVPPADPVALAAALDHAVLGMSAAERDALAARASDHTRQFDRTAVLDTILGLVSEVDVARAARV